jgi:NitT/TauT family transport system substrate-binding protein
MRSIPLLSALLVVLTGSQSSAAELKRVTIAVGTTVLDVSYSDLTLPLTLGYWRQEGYDVDLEPVGASLQAVQQMVAGNAQFAEINASAIIQSNVENGLPLRFAMVNGVNDWTISVLASSDMRDARGLKGKTIGVFSLATGGIALMNAFLANNGLNPKTDVSLVPLGLGAAPVEALRTGKVDALLYWGGATARFENAGLALRKFAPADWRQYPDYSLSIMQKTADADPAIAIAIARGIAKASVFAIANPECAVKLHWARYPETKPTGAPEDTLFKWDLNNLGMTISVLSDAFTINGGKYWGNADPAGIARLQDFLQASGLVHGALAPADYLLRIPDFYQKVNDFDADAVRDAARKCELPK